MGRKPLIAGNWKMHKTCSESEEFIQELRKELDGVNDVDIVICPPFTALTGASELLEGSAIKLGAQNVSWSNEGAFTGEISSSMLLDCGCEYVIVGHSERRHLFRETDDMISQKIRQVITTPLIPILCIGETLSERERRRVEDVVLGQLEQAVAKLTADEISRIIIAYEPVWAIGTGRTATPETAEEVHQMIRDWLSEVHSDTLAENTRILYGGSVNPGNVGELMAQKDIDGALVGGASLQSETFGQIVRYS